MLRVPPVIVVGPVNVLTPESVSVPAPSFVRLSPDAVIALAKVTAWPLVSTLMAWLPPVVGPLVGGLLGTFAYDLLIGRPLMRANANEVPASGMDPSHVEPKAAATAEAARR